MRAIARIVSPGSHFGDVVIRYPGIYTERRTNTNLPNNVYFSLPGISIEAARAMAGGVDWFFPRPNIERSSRRGRWYRCPYDGCHYRAGPGRYYRVLYHVGGRTCAGRPLWVLGDKRLPVECEAPEINFEV